MKRTYTTANGKQVSIDSIRLSNEDVIAVGNMKVNARGDQLGPGGVPEKTKQQAVNEYYNLHTPVAGAMRPGSGVIEDKPAAAKPMSVAQPAPVADPLIEEQDKVEVVKPTETKMRGSLADAVAKSTGPTRI
jgi:hypothetical protein